MNKPARGSLLGIEYLEAKDILALLKLARRMNPRKARPLLRNKRIVLLFYEASTRTRSSFEFAAKALGAMTTLVQSAGSSIEKGESLLDTVANPHAEHAYVVRFACPEFTTLCPVTGQPDFAHLVIDYVPASWLVESKSLKLYLASFRNHGAFHEDCTVMIGKRIAAEIKPKWLRIGGYWYPRGGIPIDVFWQTGKLPAGMWLPDQGVAPYRGRG